MNYQVILEVVAIDMSLETDAAVTQHKKAQADNLMGNITPAHNPSLVKSIEELRMSLLSLSNQLYIQAQATIHLIGNLIQKITLYYVQREPLTLRRFSWTIDAKDRQRTNYETLWSKIIFPYLQTRSLTEPLLRLKGADYSAFERFCKVVDKPPAYLPLHKKGTGPFEYIDLGKMLGEDFKFSLSHEKVGLQIIDILVNTTRRAMNGNLARDGWNGIGYLTVQSGKDKQVVELINFSGEALPINQEQLPYTELVRHVQRTAKNMII
jgi:hypothetical protein